jgi:hypothetical protein
MSEYKLPYFANAAEMLATQPTDKWNPFLGYHAAGTGQRQGDAFPLPELARLVNAGLLFLEVHGFPSDLVWVARRHATFEQDVLRKQHVWKTHMDATDCKLDAIMASMSPTQQQVIANSLSQVFENVQVRVQPNWWGKRRIEFSMLPYRIRLIQEEERITLTLATCHLPMARTY